VYRCYSAARTDTCTDVKGPSFHYCLYGFLSLRDISRDQNCARYSAEEREAEGKAVRVHVIRAYGGVKVQLEAL